MKELSCDKRYELKKELASLRQEAIRHRLVTTTLEARCAELEKLIRYREDEESKPWNPEILSGTKHFEPWKDK